MKYKIKIVYPLLIILLILLSIQVLGTKPTRDIIDYELTNSFNQCKDDYSIEYCKKKFIPSSMDDCNSMPNNLTNFYYVKQKCIEYFEKQNKDSSLGIFIGISIFIVISFVITKYIILKRRKK